MSKDSKKAKDKNLSGNSMFTDENRSTSPGGNSGGVSKNPAGSLAIFAGARNPLKVAIPKSDFKRKEISLSSSKSKSIEKLSPKSKSTFYAIGTHCRPPISSDSLGSVTPHSIVTGREPNCRESVPSAASMPSRPMCGEDDTSYALNILAPLSSLSIKPELVKRNSSSYADVTDNFHPLSADKKLTSSLPRETYQGSSRIGGIADPQTSDSSGLGSAQQPLLTNSHSRSTPEMTEYRNGSRGTDYTGIYGTYGNNAAPVNIEIGDRVIVRINDKDFKGVVRCRIEKSQNNMNDKEAVFGLEMDLPADYCNDGMFNKKKHFECPKNTGLFIYASQCHPLYQDFGGISCPVVDGKVAPEESLDIRGLCGRNKGIQGHYNSCYLDATLFSMFAFNIVFDDLLFRPKSEDDIEQYTRVQEVLHHKIVNPLRKNTYVRADRVMELRELLDVLSSVSGLTCEEKDPEEFLNSLLQQILKAKPLLQLSSGQESYYYQLFVEKHDKISLPTVQYLLEQSLHNSNVKLTQIPSCLIVLMPRFGKSFKVYPRIFPSLHLEVTDIIENSPRYCSVCGDGVAQFECLDCFHESSDPVNRLYAFCSLCKEKSHSPENRSRHNPTKLELPQEYLSVQDHTNIKPAFMDLFAVVCIETSHYVSFVKCGEGPDSPWCFFDSMADRKGEQNGYNIPEITECPDLAEWLSDDKYVHLTQIYSENVGYTMDRQPPNYVKRLLSDVYMCMYRSPDVCKYK